MRVVCLRTGTKYGQEYVTRLYEGMMRHSTIPFDFLVQQIEQAPGWWQKVLLFPPEVRTIFLDLDVVITGNIDFLFRYDGPLCLWGDPWNGKWNTSVMSIAPGYGTEIRRRFLVDRSHIMDTVYGDQEFVASMVHTVDLWQQIAPGKVLSYKADALADGPKTASICVLHGEPKPHQFTEGWVRDAWVAQAMVMR